MRYKKAVLILCGLMMAGCIVRPPVHPPVSLCPPRPAILDAERHLTTEGRLWLVECLNAFRDNCRALKAMRAEPLEGCDQGLR